MVGPNSLAGRLLSLLLCFFIAFSSVTPSLVYAEGTIIPPEGSGTPGGGDAPRPGWNPDTSSNARCAAQGACIQMMTASGATVNVPQVKWETRTTMPMAEAQAMIEELISPLDLKVHSEVPEFILANLQSLRKEKSEEIRQSVQANVMRENAGPPVVLGTYISSDGSLHLEAVRTLKTLDGGIEIQGVDITPYDFDLLKITQAFTTDAERKAGAPGRNPFDFAKSEASEDFQIFRELSFDAARVAMGMAMRNTGAVFGIMTVTKEDWRTWTKKKKKLLRKTIEYHTAANVESIYYVFTPAATQGGGDNATICADNPDRDDCEPELRATAGVASVQWEGGNLPKVIDKDVYHHMWKQKSSFNLLKAIVFAAAIVLTSGYLSGFVAEAGFMAAGSGASSAIVGGAFNAASLMNTTLLGNMLGTGAIMTASGISAAAVAAGVVQGVAVQLATWQPSFGRHPGVTNDHVLTLNDGKRRGKTNYLKVPEGGLRGEARKNVRDIVSGEAENAEYVPGGAVKMYEQRGQYTPDMHAERIMDFEYELSE